jgi:hypothetical protein
MACRSAITHLRQVTVNVTLHQDRDEIAGISLAHIFSKNKGDEFLNTLRFRDFYTTITSTCLEPPDEAAQAAAIHRQSGACEEEAPCCRVA